MAATAFVLAVIVGCGAGQSQTAGGSVHPKGWGAPAPRTVRLSPSLVPTAAMYDTITLSTVPAHPFALGGYTSGYWPTYLPLRRTYPQAHVVSIAVTANNHADCLDVEPGDATPGQVASWVRADRGFAKPCVYSSYWEFVTQVRPALQRAGIARSAVFEWDADYTYVPHIDAGFDATQWTDHAFGRNLDASVVTLAFLSVAQPPLTPPVPPAHQSNAKRIAYLRSLARKHHCYRKGRKPRACLVWGKEVRALSV